MGKEVAAVFDLFDLNSIWALITGNIWIALIAIVLVIGILQTALDLMAKVIGSIIIVAVAYLAFLYFM